MPDDTPVIVGSAWPKLCEWLRTGLRCRMRPTVKIDGQPYLCGWHVAVIGDPRLNDDYDEFERFCLDLLQRGYCAIWTHYPAHYLWACVRGEEPDHRPPTGCSQPGCRYAVVKSDPRAEAMTARQRIASIQALIRTRASAMTLEMSEREG